MKQKLTESQEKIDKSTIIVQIFSMTLSIINSTSGQKISKDTEDLGNTVNPLGLLDVYRSLQSTRVEYTFFSSTHGRFANYIILWSTKQASIYLNRFKSYKVCPLTMVEVNYRSITNIWKITK